MGNVREVMPVMLPSVRGLCTKSYPLHPKGCPNFNKRNTCPPKAKLLTDLLNFHSTIYCIYNEYNIEYHVEWMKSKHPAWTERQLFNCLYWQPKARAQLRLHVDGLLQLHPNLWITYCPEANGVNVTETMKQIGITLEWPPRKIAYQVALAGTLRDENGQ